MLTRVRAYAYTADGHKMLVKPEAGLLSELATAEIQAIAGPVG